MHRDGLSTPSTLQHRRRWSSLLGAAALAASGTPATAADGCKVLLCLAAPNWRAIQECVPTIREVMRDLARGRPFPVCRMSGHGSTAVHDWAQAPSYCPPQYTHLVWGDSLSYYVCDYAGAITTVIDGEWFTRTWWNFGEDTVTEFSTSAKARLGNWDPRFDNEYAAWLASQPPAVPPADQP